MMDVELRVNRRLIHRIRVVRQEDPDEDGQALYETDRGTTVRHDPDDGAEALAIKLLENEPIPTDEMDPPK